MQVQGIVPGPVVVFIASVLPVVPFPFQAFHGGIRRKFPDLLQHGFPDLFAPALHPALIDLEGLEQDVLFGVHDGQRVLEALGGVFGSVHMDVHPAGRVHNSPRPAQGADNLLQLSHFAVFELGGIHFHLVLILRIAAPFRADRPDAGVINDLPDLLLPVGDLVGFVCPAQVPELGSEQRAQRLRCLPPGQTRHLDLAAEVLIL